MENLYMKHIAIGGVLKAIERVGGAAQHVGLYRIGDEQYWRKLILSPKPDEGRIAQIAFTLDTPYGDRGRAERDRLAVALLDALHGSFSDREGNELSVYGVMHGMTYQIRVGEALCERVQTGTKIVLRPAEGTPMVEVEEPVYDYRCSDDIMGRLPEAVAS